jgi:hypothetical protein
MPINLLVHWFTRVAIPIHTPRMVNITYFFRVFFKFFQAKLWNDFKRPGLLFRTIMYTYISII